MATVMIFLTGKKKSFRCECGCNVFIRLGEVGERYRCNACPREYEGE